MAESDAAAGAGDSSEEEPRRPRSLTSLTLQWFAERMRKMERIKERVSSGSYDVDSKKVAEALIEGEPSPVKKVE